MKAILVALTLLTACGSAEESTNEDTYDQEWINDWHSSCVDNQLTNGEGFTETSAARFCSCVYTEFSHRWSKYEFTARGEECWQDLRRAGTIDTCLR